MPHTASRHAARNTTARHAAQGAPSRSVQHHATIYRTQRPVTQHAIPQTAPSHAARHRTARHTAQGAPSRSAPKAWCTRSAPPQAAGVQGRAFTTAIVPPTACCGHVKTPIRHARAVYAGGGVAGITTQGTGEIDANAPTLTHSRSYAAAHSPNRSASALPPPQSSSSSAHGRGTQTRRRTRQSLARGCTQVARAAHRRENLSPSSKRAPIASLRLVMFWSDLCTLQRSHGSVHARACAFIPVSAINQEIAPYASAVRCTPYP
jgi:hypothetical protein